MLDRYKKGGNVLELVKLIETLPSRRK